MTWTERHAARHLLILALASTGCSRKPIPPPVISQTGVASWYGHPFNGRQTASGEIYDMENLTAAHRTYTFGTVARVTNQANGKSVEVRITDRGPFVAERIIDLSHAAAQKISMPYTANVHLEVISTPRTRGLQAYAVQTGDFQERSAADVFLQRMRGQYGDAKLVFRPGDKSWRVLVGRLPTADKAASVAQEIERQIGPAFVVLLDDEE